MRKNWGRMLAALLVMLLLPALALAADFAVVSGGKLNLRKYASTSSVSLGKYATGTWVQLMGEKQNGWYSVRTLDGKYGYMYASYLTLPVSGKTGTLKYAPGNYVNMRSGPSLSYSVIIRANSGTAVTIIDDSYEWNYVMLSQNGHSYSGYIHDSLIQKAAGTAVVTTRNGGKVNVRSGPSSSFSGLGSLPSGTTVNVLLKGNGWYMISGGGLTGFMSSSYLSGGGGGGGGSYEPTSSRTAWVNNPRSTQVLNLREYASQSARSIGQYRNGTPVKVVSYGSTWCEVYVGTRHGYMMTRYLSFDGNYVQPSYPQNTPVYVYVTPTPAPIVQITPKPQYGVGETPKAGTIGTLAVAAGSGSSMITVYEDATMSAVKGVYSPGQKITILQYGSNVCMILVGGELGYASTWNVNY